MIRLEVEEPELIGVIVTFGGIGSLLRAVEVVCVRNCNAIKFLSPSASLYLTFFKIVYYA